MGTRHRFAGFVLDVARRELRAGDALVELQPQVFDLLSYLVEHRDRVVGKDELLSALWPDVTVSEGSLQRTMSLLRSALGDAGDAIVRTFPRRGYRFVADVAEAEGANLGGDLVAAAFAAPPRYVRRGGAHLACRVIGAGDVDLLLSPGWAFPMSAWAGHSRLRARCAALAGIGRVILFDKRGVGLSDPIKRAPGLEERVADALAVLDAVGARRAIVVGISEGAPMALLLAAAHPERVRGLVLVGAFACMAWAPDHPHGWSDERVAALRGYIGSHWGAGATLRAMVPAHAHEPEVVRWAADAELQGASPGAALDLVDVNLAIDARALAAGVHVPAVVLHQRDDAVIPVGNGRELARQLRGARYVELPGDDHAFVFEGGEVLVEEVATLVRHTAEDVTVEDRFLTTALVALIDGASAHAVERLLRAQAATSVECAGDRLSGCFDSPARALRCAAALLEAQGARVRLGVHVGEVTRSGGRLTGRALEEAHELAASAPRGELRTSRLVKELVGDAGE